MIERNAHQDPEPTSTCTVSRRSVLASLGGTLIAGLAGCSGSDTPSTATGSPTASSTPGAADSVFQGISFAGPNLVVTLKSDHDVNRLNLISPDGSAFRQTGVAEGATRVDLQILSKTGGSYPAGEYELVAVTGDSSESMPLELRPDVRVVAVEPEFDADDQNSTGRLFVTVENVGTGPTWISNIGFRNAPYRNAPQVIEGDGVADTTFERPAESDDEFLSPDTERVFLKRRGVLVISDNDDVSCDGDTTELTVVVQTPHGDIAQPIRARLSGGYHIDDRGAIQHPCKNVEIELLDRGGENA